jgi:hypothetical protein
VPLPVPASPGPTDHTPTGHLRQVGSRDQNVAMLDTGWMLTVQIDTVLLTILVCWLKNRLYIFTLVEIPNNYTLYYTGHRHIQIIVN